MLSEGVACDEDYGLRTWRATRTTSFARSGLGLKLLVY